MSACSGEDWESPAAFSYSINSLYTVKSAYVPITIAIVI